MRTTVDPRQTPLFDPFGPVLGPATRDGLLAGWQGMFRHVILELMPVGVLGGSFDPRIGRPTKELYSMAGLLFIKEFMNWTKEEALNAYRYRLDVHYALNLEPVAHELSLRTLERYERLFIENDLAGQVMHEVTTTLADLCEIKVDQQRLDSTHVFSNMASFGRTRLMGVTVKRFLVQVKRFDREAYEGLAEELRKRYEPSEHKLFGGLGKDEASRRLLREQVAEDMHALIERFCDDERHNNRSTYKMLVRVFHEQCDVEEETVRIRKKTGGDVVQNPSDEDATYDGHKGPGYQAQIAETCDPENEVQFITSALPQTAVKSDAAALPEVLDDLEAQQLTPESMLADASYGSDENVEDAASRGVELVSPTKEGARETEETSDAYSELTIDDFAIDEETEAITACPAGIEPESSTHDPSSGKTTTIMPAAACDACAFSGACPVRRVRGQYRLEHTAKQRRLAARRREEQTDVFRKRYRTRAGIEGTNSGIKRRTGLNRLRVRGKARVFNAIVLRLAGWNVLRAAVCTKMRQIVAERARSASLQAYFSQLRALVRHSGPRQAISRINSPSHGRLPVRYALRPAA